MIAVEEPGVLQSAAVEPDGGWAADAAADSALLATLTTRMHCRRPMQVIDPAGPSLSQPLTIGAGTLAEAPRKSQALAAGIVTYRCSCGSTIDVPAEAGMTGAA
ncbi:hypothetical protein HER39_14965 [Arthrobacter deserti]|uniref:DUF222 domain-containing protein n=1 Tax=Arthrobacter deserti TaxID=1742687 RepID=A0ABX1JS78_9MICC|nr:hypothetical protein [Arthrobacter deserti]